MRIYFVAGEASGDNHGAALMQALRRLQPDLQLLGRGGPQMKAVAGDRFLDWSDEAGVVGLWEVVKHYGYFRREFRKTLREIAQAKPEAVVLIDYPGFNLRLARTLHEGSLGGKIIYYISPQVWAWNRGRIPQMARWLDLMLCIFPFEAELYEQSGLRTIFVGHPMIEDLATKRIECCARSPSRWSVSRQPDARGAAALADPDRGHAGAGMRNGPDLKFEIAAASPAVADLIRRHFPPGSMSSDSLGKISIVVGRAAETMQKSAAAVVASGTATLEAAFFRLPFVLVYKVAAMTYLAGRMLIRVKHLGMPNVLADREIVPEFIQGKAEPSAIAREVMQLLDDRRAP